MPSLLRGILFLQLVASGTGGAMLLAQDPSGRVIRGRTVDSSGAGISFALVEQSLSRRTIADESGAFSFRTPSHGATTLVVRRLGYVSATLKLPPGADTAVQIVLEAIPRRLSPVVVEAQVSERLNAVGFYDRLRQRHWSSGSGTFITAEDIEARNPLRVSQMLDGIPSVRVQKMDATTTRWEIRGPRGCQYTVYVNGARVGPRERMGIMQPVWIDELLEPGSTAGIEVYPRATGAPPGTQMLNGTCGIAVFWTK